MKAGMGTPVFSRGGGNHGRDFDHPEHQDRRPGRVGPRLPARPREVRAGLSDRPQRQRQRHLDFPGCGRHELLPSDQAAAVWTGSEIEAFDEADLEARQDLPPLAPMGVYTCYGTRADAVRANRRMTWQLGRCAHG
jgi:hypothetical protein